MVNLVDAISKHEKNPETFWIPGKEELLSVGNGCWVKLIFTDPQGELGERMWVKVKERSKENWKGNLDNSPLNPNELGIDYGDEIEFKTKNIINYECNW